MATLEARIVALEGGRKRGGCLTCEILSIGEPPGTPMPPCTHSPITLVEILASLPPDDWKSPLPTVADEPK